MRPISPATMRSVRFGICASSCVISWACIETLSKRLPKRPFQTTQTIMIDPTEKTELLGLISDLRSHASSAVRASDQKRAIRAAESAVTDLAECLKRFVALIDKHS